MRSTLGFAARFLVAYVLFVVLWVGVLEQRYNDALASVCRHLLFALEEPHLTTDVQRHGNLLVVSHLPHFEQLAPQEIVTRRVHRNTSLFVALTLTTPGPGWALRGLWLAGGGLLLAVSHVGHVIAFAHQHYALHNLGPYFTTVPVDRLARLGWLELWARPAARRRALALATANLFNIVLQRVVPIFLWLPLFLGTLASRRPHLRFGPALGPLAVGAVIVLAAVLALGHGSRAAPPDTIEGVRLGMGAIAAKLVLEQRGYEWTARPRALGASAQAVADLWPRRGPLTERRYGPRYNWLGVRVTMPPDAPPDLGAACVSGIVTAPSDERPERLALMPGDPLGVCRPYWASYSATAHTPGPVIAPDPAETVCRTHRPSCQGHG